MHHQPQELGDLRLEWMGFGNGFGLRGHARSLN